jgi:hypothetical protein
LELQRRKQTYRAATAASGYNREQVRNSRRRRRKRSS